MFKGGQKELNGTYGGDKTPCTVFYYEGWYCVEDSKNVNFTHEVLEDGVDVELVEDADCFTWSSDIGSLEELAEAVEA